jgi:hypothetical protein
MSNLTDHARDELERVGMFESDADYGGALGHAVMELIETFDRQQHSGLSAAVTLELFRKLASYESLSDITSDPDEWENVSDISDAPLWQNKRRCTSFSRDGGKTWYDIQDASLNHGDTWLTPDETRKLLLDYGYRGDENIVIDNPTKMRMFESLYEIQKQHLPEEFQQGSIFIDQAINRKLRETYGDDTL